VAGTVKLNNHTEKLAGLGSLFAGRAMRLGNDLADDQ
jgi:hypothetical protein